VNAYRFTLPASYTTSIVIDLSEFRLYWIVDGFMKKSYGIAIGKDLTPTPVAEWKVGEKHYEDPKGVFGPRRLRLYRLAGGKYTRTGYGIHGTNEPWVIGSQASHGCIRLKNSDILELWPQVDVGVRVLTQR
jgi:lipoprotein-anchoring transpeptidase ErfK/SrfK